MITYAETDKRLAVRIRAHTHFANFQLEDWLADRLRLSAGSRVVDIACGDGNFFPVYAARIGGGGLIVGTDLSDSLLAAARRRLGGLAPRGLILKWNFDNAYPFLDGEFDCTLCLFAAYYARDARAWVDEAVRVTWPGGQILLIGPADDNAAELYDLNDAVTGTRTVRETDFTTGRLEREFVPALRARLDGEVHCEILDRKIVFPSPREFADYYLATWLYEKMAEGLGRQFDPEHIESRVRTCTLSKRVVVVEARR
jgi:SAM-dependent methyltransferase